MDWNLLLSEKRLRPTSREKNEFDSRNEFESDYGRIIFSPAIRRMHDKTQVFPLTSDDNIHTRLTHSLEVQSVANSIGINICQNENFLSIVKKDKTELFRTIPTILSSTALCHDIGNPPFGHFGEEIISNYFENYFREHPNTDLNEYEKLDFTKFNGNAQGFRILTKTQVLQDTYGLNLTIGTLHAYIKYPHLAEELDSCNYRKKVGVFQSEKKIFEEIREHIGLTTEKNPLVFLLEASDTICYLTMDIEDGFNKKFYNFDFIISYIKKNGNNKVKELIENFDKKLKERMTLAINAERTKMVKLRIFLIQKLVDIACQNFIANLDEIQKGNYHQELILEEKGGLGDTLSKFCKEYIFNTKEIQTLELTGESVLKGLLDQFVPTLLSCKDKKYFNYSRAKRLYNIISTSLKNTIKIETKNTNFYELTDYNKLRLIVDFISGMTDTYALNLYQKLLGIKIA